MQLHGFSSKGSVRKDNQDSYYAADLGGGRAILGVFDGMGGLENGARTSGKVLLAVKEAVESGIRTGGLDIESALRGINTTIYNESKEHGDGLSGSTATVAFVDGVNVRIWHCGDSRAMVVRGGQVLGMLTHDDTAYNRFYAEAKTPNEKYADSRYRSVLVRAVGVSPEVKLLINDYQLGYNDSLLLCSDGFWHCIEDGRVSLPRMGIGLALPGLVGQIEGKGEKDNITACVAEGIGVS